MARSDGHFDSRSTWTIEVVGAEDMAVFDEDALRSLPTVEKSIAYDCASEGRRMARWVGVPIIDLLEAAGVDGEVTHLGLSARDGHGAVVAVEEAVAGLIALEAFAGSDSTADWTPDGCPRLVAPGLSAARTVKGVQRIDAMQSEPDEEPAEPALDSTSRDPA